MYQAEFLSSFPYFEKALKTMPLSSIHDSLTGLISRPYILGFIHDLIAQKTPFTLAIIDLDNFKSVNDNYGHAIGDGLLTMTGQCLQNFVGQDGLLGRFGGDEFLMIYFKSIEYSGIHDFFDSLFEKEIVLRKTYSVDGINIFLTATIGSASFPVDAQDYDGLFAKVDKTLYRGKSKGRNCYIIYVESKHGHLEIPKLAKHSLYTVFQEMAKGFDEETSLHRQLLQAFDSLQLGMRLSALMYLNENGELRDLISGQDFGQTGGADSLMENGLYAPNNLAELMDVNPALASLLVKIGYESALFYQVKTKAWGPGCLILCPEAHTMHIWQDEEFTAAFFLSWLMEHCAADE